MPSHSEVIEKLIRERDEGSGAVGRYLDGLPRDRRVVVFATCASCERTWEQKPTGPARCHLCGRKLVKKVKRFRVAELEASSAREAGRL